jgi:hypothetical protein
VKYLFGTLVLLSLHIIVLGQKGKVLTATQQCWSGGIAGRHGCNYSFVISFRDVRQQMIADTLWIGDYAVKLTERISNNSNGNMTVKSMGKAVRYEINAGTHYDDNERYMVSIKPTETIAPTPPNNHGAVATLAYWYGGERRYFAVLKILRRLAPVAYP